jgi:signal transduction histidine kinase
MKIRSRLLLFILYVLLPATAAGVIAVWFIYAEQREAQDKTLAEAARVLSHLVDTQLESSEQFLTALVGSPDLASGNLQRFHEHAKALSLNGQSTIILSSLDGRMLLNTRLPLDAPSGLLDPGLVDIRNAIGPRTTAFSDLFFAPIARRYDVAVQVPVVVDGSVRYYLSRGIEAQAFQRFLLRQGFPDTWIASIVDRNGRVIARSVNSEQYIGRSATGTLLEKIRRGSPSGINEGFTLEGQPVKAFFHRAPRSNWTVVLSVPTAELMRPALHASLLLAGLIALTFLGAFILSRRQLASFLAPIHRLRDDAQRLGQGNAVTPFVSGLDELDLVNRSMVGASSELRDARATMERRVAEAIASTERAQRTLLHSQKLEALGRLTGGVAHDFNNVLQTLTSALQLVTLEANPAKLPDRIAVCRNAVERAAALVAQLRAFGRTQDAYLQTLRADDALASALPMLENSLPSAVRLGTVIADDLWPINIDATQFELALLNLVINARDAIAGQGQITIEASNHIEKGGDNPLRPGAYVCIRIIDTGAGMSPDVLARAFDPFFTTKPVDKGSGLGLAQAYGFATQAQGMLRLESTVGAGTIASLYLPRAHDDRAPAARSTRQEETHGVPALNATVLFVEDDSLVRESVAPILEEAGAIVLRAQNGQEALRIIESGQQVDVLFSDIVMPGELNGVMLAKQVRERYPQIAVLLATGYFEKEIDLPGVRLLTKPYDARSAIDELARAVKRSLA